MFYVKAVICFTQKGINRINYSLFNNNISMAIPFNDKREKYLFRETLSSVLLGLLEEKTVIDLRNEASIHGKIVAVSGYMDIELEDCVFRNPRGEYFPFDTFFVKSRNIRYVHIPKHLTATQVMDVGLQKLHRPVTQPRGSKNIFKLKRAQIYQNEIIKELHELHNKPSTSS